MSEILLKIISSEIDDEMRKTARKRDDMRIRELSEKYFEVSGAGTAERSAAKRRLIEAVSHEERKSNIKIRRGVSAVAACAAIFIALNTASMNVFGQNMFSAIYSLSRDGITIDIKNSEEEQIFGKGNDYMKKRCAEHGFFPETPSYIPENFELADIYENSDIVSENVKFFYRCGSSKLNFDFHFYKNADDIPPIGIPTDSYNVTEEKINGHIFYILKEEDQFTATYLERNIVYCIVSHGIDYKVYKRILENTV